MPSTQSTLVRFWPWLVLVLTLLFTGYIRYRLLNMPLERDEGEYAYAGQLIMQGIPPYELACNMKLPGMYYACALGMTIFGQTIAGMHATLMVVNSLTVIFIFLLGRRMFGAGVGLIAAISYAIMSVSPNVLGLATHANQVVVLFAVPATLFLWRAGESGRRTFMLFSGLLYGLAFITKQQSVFYCIFGGAYLLWLGIQSRNAVGTIRNLFCFGAGVFVPYLTVCLVMVGAGNFSQFWFWTFTYAHTYIDTLSWSEGFQWFMVHMKWLAPAMVLLWILGGMGLWLGWRDPGLRRRTIFIAAWWGFSFFGTATGLYFRAHYFILVLPAFSLLIGLAVVALPGIFPARLPLPLGQGMVLASFVLIVAWNIFFQRNLLFYMSGDELNRFEYGRAPFVESLPVADYIREHSSSDARVAVLGSEPQVYFYAQRHSVTGYLYTHQMMQLQPLAHRMEMGMIHDIESVRPQYLVWMGFRSSWLNIPGSDETIFKWYPGYAAKYYDLAGVVILRPDGTDESFWDDDVEKFHGQADDYIAVYRLRPGAELHPASR